MYPTSYYLLRNHFKLHRQSLLTEKIDSNFRSYIYIYIFLWQVCNGFWGANAKQAGGPGEHAGGGGGGGGGGKHTGAGYIGEQGAGVGEEGEAGDIGGEGEDGEGGGQGGEGGGQRTCAGNIGREGGLSLGKEEGFWNESLLYTVRLNILKWKFTLYGPVKYVEMYWRTYFLDSWAWNLKDYCWTRLPSFLFGVLTFV